MYFSYRGNCKHGVLARDTNTIQGRYHGNFQSFGRIGVLHQHWWDRKGLDGMSRSFEGFYVNDCLGQTEYHSIRAYRNIDMWYQ